MKLYYRGVGYKYDLTKVESRKRQPFKQVRESGAAYNLTYRGVSYRIDPNAKQDEETAPLIPNQLIYRGITYSLIQTA